MAITLVSDISATTRHVAVTGGTLDRGKFFRVDDELMFVHAYIDDPGATRRSSKTANPYSWVIARAQGGSVAAAHSSGATVTAAADVWGADMFSAGGGAIAITDGTTTVNPATSLRLPAGTLTDLGGGEGEVGLVMSLVGPFRVNWNDPGVNNPRPPDIGPAILTVAAGSVFQVFVAIVTEWDQPGQLIVRGGQPSGSPTPGYLGRYDTTANSDAFLRLGALEYSIDSANVLAAGSIRWAVALQESVVCVQFQTDDLDPTAGAADIYAIIATPAA